MTLRADSDVDVTVNLLDMTGNLVLSLMRGTVFADWDTSVEIKVNDLESGMYQIQVSTKEFVTTKKLLVTD